MGVYSRVFVTASIAVSVIPYMIFFGRALVFHDNDLINAAVLVGPWLLLLVMAVFWVFGRRLGWVIPAVATCVCAPLAVLSLLLGIGMLLLMPVILFAVFLVRYHIGLLAGVDRPGSTT